MVKIIYNAKQNPPLIGAILIQQKTSTKTLKIAARKDLTNQRNQWAQNSQQLQNPSNQRCAMVSLKLQKSIRKSNLETSLNKTWIANKIESADFF